MRYVPAHVRHLRMHALAEKISSLAQAVALSNRLELISRGGYFRRVNTLRIHALARHAKILADYNRATTDRKNASKKK